MPRRDHVMLRYQKSVDDGVYPVVRDCMNLPQDLLSKVSTFRDLSQAPVQRAGLSEYQALFGDPVATGDFAVNRLEPCFCYCPGRNNRGEGNRKDEVPLKEASPGNHLRRLRQGRRQRFPGVRADPMADTHIYDLIDNWISGSVRDLDDYYRHERRRFDAAYLTQISFCLVWIGNLAASVAFGPAVAAFMPDWKRTDAFLIGGGLSVIMALLIGVLGLMARSPRNAAVALQTAMAQQLNLALQAKSRRLSEELGRHLSSLRETMCHMLTQAAADRYEAWDRNQPKAWARGQVIWKLGALWHKERYEALTADMRDAHCQVETAFRGVRDEAHFRHRHYSLNGFHPIDRSQMRALPWLFLMGIGYGLAIDGIIHSGFAPLSLIWIVASLVGLLASLGLGFMGCVRLEQGLIKSLPNAALRDAVAQGFPLEMRETDLARYDQVMSEKERTETLSRLQEEGLRSR